MRHHRNDLGFLNSWFGTRRSVVRIHSPRPILLGPARRHRLQNVPETWVTEGRPLGVRFLLLSPPLGLPSRFKVCCALRLCLAPRLRLHLIAPAPALQWASGHSSFRWCAGLHGFSLIREVMPPQKNRSTSSLSRNFSAIIQRCLFLVSFEPLGRMGSRAVQAPESLDRSTPDHNP